MRNCQVSERAGKELPSLLEERTHVEDFQEAFEIIGGFSFTRAEAFICCSVNGGRNNLTTCWNIDEYIQRFPSFCLSVPVSCISICLFQFIYRSDYLSLPPSLPPPPPPPMEDTSASPETVFLNLPEDVLMEILSLLPAKSLLRFRSVCKHWYSLIQNPSFISKHHNQSKTLNRNESLLVCRSLRTRDEQTRPEIWNIVDSGLSISLVDNQTLTPFSHIDLGLWSPSWQMIGGSHYGGLGVSGHCNGIICINDADDINHIILCNPATREFKALPLPSFSYPQHTTAKCRTVGFGYDPVSDDYKVVKILVLYELSPDGRSCRCYYKTQIYNLSTDSWREIDAFMPVSPVFLYPSFEIFFNGAFHWHGVDERFDSESIVAFDMKDEVFRQMEFPDCCSYPFVDGKSRILSAWNDSLALVLYDYSEPHEMFVEIWVMKEYGVKESWTREFVSEPLIGMNGPLAIWKDSELLLESSSGQLVSINLYNHRIREFEGYVIPERLQALLFTESLVSVNRFRQVT